ncbi:unnamed protein product [Spirodela intermedia]|uniref:Cytochrome b5 heme-binding domain-containing protein n=1 Tax=Spirodela intermedia TaxID=51605 RepID=A0A7I8J4C2_SPIIN|nr:unnamed protein product [Spirodela intermedia]CAA6664921.1 unnamed protein product [Spirodela intermedia]
MVTSVDNRRFGYLEKGGGKLPSPFVSEPGDSFSNGGAASFRRHHHHHHHHEDSDDEDPDYEEYIAALKASSGAGDIEPSALDARDEATPDAWVERNSSLIRLTGKHPFNSEPHLTRLMHHGFITPVPLHYVRNHGAVGGLVRRPSRLSMDEIAGEFAARELPVTLACCGNRRKEQNMVKQTIGFNWGPAVVSTGVWRGARLCDVLRRCGVMRRPPSADLPGGGGSKYGTSLPLEVALDPANDILLAYMHNGEFLSPDHGFPVRLIIPGYTGGRMVKWLRRILITTAECDNYYHYHDNKVLPSFVDAELAEADGWWYRQEYMINELNINSVITTPAHDEILPINSVTSQRSYTMKGYAYAGGGKKVTRVEVTLDGGETWLQCELDQPERPNKYGKYWCWCFWSVDLEVLDLLGAKEIAVRAWDQALNTQPEKLIWNVLGMLNNCWFRVRMNVCRPHRGEIGLVFEHPTKPGNQTGGWMAREKHLEVTEGQSMQKSVSSPFMNTATKHYSMSEVRRHSTRDSAWIVVHGRVYDCTSFLKDHPGGADSILINAGTDCTEDFDAIHSEKAKSMLETYRVGELITTGYLSDTSNHGANNLALLSSIAEAAAPPRRAVALVSREKIQCRLVSKTSLSHDVRRFRFALPAADQVLGLPVGKHIFLSASSTARPACERTPLRAPTVRSAISSWSSPGAGSCRSTSIPSPRRRRRREGPLGHIEYTGAGNFSVNGERKRAKKLAMVAGGTGITPIYQVMQAVLRDPEDQTEMHLVYANRSEDDILLREELDGWAKKRSEQVKVWYVVSEAKDPGWTYSVGFVTEEILRQRVPAAAEDVLALACGPPPMLQFAVAPILEKMGYDVKNALLQF